MHTLRDKLRAACHDLKMNSLTKVEESVINGLRSRIAHLPSPESINAMPRTELLSLKARIEGLIFDIDNSDNSRTHDYATRHMIDKGLPPYRPPVLASSWYKKVQDSK